jgi:hypothetical protein
MNSLGSHESIVTSRQSKEAIVTRGSAVSHEEAKD